MTALYLTCDQKNGKIYPTMYVSAKLNFFNQSLNVHTTYIHVQ